MALAGFGSPGLGLNARALIPLSRIGREIRLELVRLAVEFLAVGGPSRLMVMFGQAFA